MKHIKNKLGHDDQILLIARIIKKKGIMSFLDVIREMEKLEGPKSTNGLKSTGTLYRRMKYLLNTDIAMRNNIQKIEKGRMLHIGLRVPKGTTSIPANSLSEFSNPEDKSTNNKPYSVTVDDKTFQFPSVNECGCDGHILRAAAFKAIATFLDTLSQ